MCVLMDATLRILFPWPVSTTPRNGDFLYGWVESSQPHIDPKRRKLQTLIILGFTRAASSEALRGALQSICAADPSLEESLSNCGGQLGVCGRWGEEGRDGRDPKLWVSWGTETFDGFPRLSNVKCKGACSRIHVVFYTPPVGGEQHLAIESKGAWSGVLEFNNPQNQPDGFPLHHAVEIINLGPHVDGSIRRHLEGLHASNVNPCQHQSARFLGIPNSLSLGKAWISETGRHVLVMVGALRCEPLHDLPRSVALENCVRIRTWHFWFTVAVQWMMGSLLCILLFHFLPSISSAFTGSIPVFRRFMREHIAWLSGAPAGIKLHLELAELYAWASTVVMEMAILVFDSVAPYVPMVVGFVSICSCLGGAGLGLALISDCLWIVSMPVTTMHIGMSIVYSYQLKFLGITWKLLRGQHSSKGRKLRQRRNRSKKNLKEEGDQDKSGVENTAGPDKKKKDDEVLMEHLIVGVLLFTPLLALLPTTFVFYLFFLALYLSVAATCLLLTMVSDALLANPVFFLVCRMARPGLFPGGFRLVGLEASQLGVSQKESSSSRRKSTVDCCYFELQSLPAPWGQFPAFAAGLVFRRRSLFISLENLKAMCAGKLGVWKRGV